MEISMSLPDVTPDQILSAIEHVPASRWPEALRAIQNLQDSTPPTVPASSSIRTGSDLRESGLIGVWADRNDITNNHEFARELRRQAEQRE
jgi:hypothetical protein